MTFAIIQSAVINGQQCLQVPIFPRDSIIFKQLYSQPYLLLSLSSLFWAGNAIIGRLLKDYVGAIDMNLIRWVIATIIFLPIAYSAVKKDHALIIKHWRFITLLGILGIASFQTFLYLSLQTTTVINALLLLSLCPVLIFIGNILFYREWPGLSAMLGVILSFLGILVLISHGQIEALRTLAFAPGDLWILLASAIWAAYSIALRKRPSGLSQSSMLFGSMVAGVIFLIPMSILNDHNEQLLEWTASVYIALIYLAIFPSILAFICWNRGVELAGSSKAGGFLHLIPVFGAALSIIFLGEGIALFHLVGGLFVFGGVTLTTRH